MPTSKPKVIVVTRDWSGLGLGLLMQSQGSEVIFAYKFGEMDPKDEEATELCGDGLIEKIPLGDATRKFLSQDAIWVFDTNENSEIADRLSKAGEAVIGTSGLSAKMENDRLFAGKVAKAVGMDLPETKEFSSLDEGVRFLESRKSDAFVYKPNEGDPTSTFVPQELDEPAKSNELLREYLSSLKEEGNTSFVLQALIPNGIEANFEMWLRDGEPIVAFLDLESKRKLTGDLGGLIGCAGGYVAKVPLHSKGVEQTVSGYLRLKELAHYTGSVDANVIFAEEKVYFLENCFRFGYNAYPELFYGLAKKPVETILREWATGTGRVDTMFNAGFAGSLTLVSDSCQKGAPILIPKEIKNHVCLYQAYQEDGHLMEVGGWPEIACVIDAGWTIEETGLKCLDLARAVAFPNKGHRTDLADADAPHLPLRRYRALATRGLLR